MGVKYVKDFSFPSSGGFHGDVQRYAKGGHVTKVPAKAKASAKGMPARAKPNAPAKGAPKMMSKPKVGKGQGYAEGGEVNNQQKEIDIVSYVKKGIAAGLKPGTPEFSKYIARMPQLSKGIAKNPTQTPTQKTPQPAKRESYMPPTASSYLRPKKSFDFEGDEEDLSSAMKREATGYNEGGRVPGYEMDRLPTKKPPGRGKDLAPSKPFKGAYEGYADGGEIGIAEDPTYEERMDRMRQRGDERLPVRGEIIAPMARDPFERTSGPGTPDGMKVNPRYGQPGESYYVPDMTREGMGETRGGAGELIDVVSPLDRAAAIRRRAMMPDANLMRRAAQAVRAPMVERGRPMPMEREDIVRSPRQMMQQRGPRGMINRLRDQIARRVPRGEVMPQPQTIPGRQPALDIGNLPKPPPGYKPKQYIASGDIRFNPETGEYGPSIFQEITDTAPPAGFVPTFEGRFAKGGRVTKGEKKISKVMGEYKRGELHSGSKKGPLVKGRKQAVAIALSEARKAGAKIPKKAEGGPLSYAESGSKAPKERSFKEAFRDAREVAKREGRDPDKEVFTWKGEKYKANLEKKVSPEKKETSEKSSRRMSSEEFVKEYEKAPASGRMKQEAYYKARPEPGAEMVSPEEAILGPKAKAALAGAGATAAGYGLKKARDFLMRRGQKARSEAADVLKGSGAMSRSAAAREAEAAAYAERLKNARRSPGMTGYAKGGEVDYTKAKDLKNKGIFNDEYLAYGDKKEPYRGSPKKAKMLGRQDRLAREAMERAEKYAPGMSLDMKAKGGLSKHEDVKMDKQLIRSAVHKHESAMHPGKAKTKLRHGGMPSYGRKPMYGGGKC